MKLSLALLYSTSTAVSAFQSSTSSPSFLARKSSVNMGNDDVIVIDKPTPEIQGKPLQDPMNLYSAGSKERQDGRIQSKEEPDMVSNKAIYDPMNLYSTDTKERQDGQIQSNEEPAAASNKAIYDPMNLYSAGSEERQDGRIQPNEELDIVSNKNIVDPMNLYSAGSEERQDGRIQSNEEESDIVSNKAIYDPLGIYPNDSEERKNEQIKASEPELKVIKAVVDPMNIYSNKESIDGDAVMSQALPFVTRPIVLDGSMAGDAGFDPLGFAQTKEDLMNYREAEIKHARLAMLAAAGWPLSELLDKKIALFLHMTPIVDAADRVPSILNGGLERVNPFYWMAVLAGAAAIDMFGIAKSKSDDESYFPGNLGFDPLGVYPKTEEGQQRMQLAEIKNGRLAMIAVFGFAIQEFVTKAAVVDETPFFFLPFFGNH